MFNLKHTKYVIHMSPNILIAAFKHLHIKLIIPTYFNSYFTKVKEPAYFFRKLQSNCDGVNIGTYSRVNSPFLYLTKAYIPNTEYAAFNQTFSRKSLQHGNTLRPSVKN